MSSIVHLASERESSCWMSTVLRFATDPRAESQPGRAPTHHLYEWVVGAPPKRGTTAFVVVPKRAVGAKCRTFLMICCYQPSKVYM